MTRVDYGYRLDTYAPQTTQYSYQVAETQIVREVSSYMLYGYSSDVDLNYVEAYIGGADPYGADIYLTTATPTTAQMETQYGGQRYMETSNAGLFVIEAVQSSGGYQIAFRNENYTRYEIYPTIFADEPKIMLTADSVDVDESTQKLSDLSVYVYDGASVIYISPYDGGVDYYAAIGDITLINPRLVQTDSAYTVTGTVT